jgi:hypothetical protein
LTYRLRFAIARWMVIHDDKESAPHVRSSTKLRTLRSDHRQGHTVPGLGHARLRPTTLSSAPAQIRREERVP